jgi:dihydroneopterin triphosphate diphosphatase
MPQILSDWIHAFVFRLHPVHEFEILLLHRSADEIILPGIWQIVTGGIDAGETAFDAARREVAEETGFLCDELIVLPYVGSFYFAKKDAIEMQAAFACRATPDFEVRLSHEHQNFRWLPYDEAMEKLVFPTQKEGLTILRDYVIRKPENYPLHVIFFQTDDSGHETV